MAAPTPALEIHIDNTSRCRVISGPERRTYYSTPQLAGLALLHMYGGEDPAPVAASRSIAWSDNLATHGIAHGVRSDHRYVIAVIPAAPRTIQYRSRDDYSPRSLTATFPPLLVALHFGASNFQRGLVYCVNPATLPRLRLALTDAALTSFPYGNVYNATGRICWGTVRHSHISDLPGFLDLFFNSEFNSDLYHGPNGNLPAAIQAAPQGVLPLSSNYHISMPTALAQLTGA